MSQRIGTLLLALGLVGQAQAAPAPRADSAPDGEHAAEAAQSAQGTVSLTRWTIDAGGTTHVSGGGFRLAATIGQPDAARVSAAGYVLSAGFWAPRAAAPSGDAIFVDGFEVP